MTANILLICGSLNQTTMMHKISGYLSEFNCFFTPFYVDGWKNLAAKMGLLDFSILGGQHRRDTLAYLKKEGLPVDYGGKRNHYEAVITCTDLIIQNNIGKKRLMLVQEGMTEEEDFLFFLVRNLNFPRYLANTAATGLSNAYDVFCVASKGYRDLFVQKGAKPEKIIVTGIPNYDNAVQHTENSFPRKGYVLAATSSIRETMKFDNREEYLKQVKRIAGQRQVIFKLHPNEDHKRARREIFRYFQNAPIYTDGNIHDMIANCDVLVAQTSSVVFTGLSLGKEVYSYFDIETLKKLLPIQNGGKSAEKIAEVCRRLIYTPLAEVKWAGAKNKFSRKLRAMDIV
ncbi:MAG: hypothetical protein AB9891_13825 [Anaerolineaceae bacterium]